VFPILVTIRIRYFGSIRGLIERGAEDLELASNSTLKDAISRLALIHGPKFRDYLISANGYFENGCARILLDGNQLSSMSELENMILTEGSDVRVLAILPPWLEDSEVVI
jgi:hypothetical protein